MTTDAAAATERAGGDEEEGGGLARDRQVTLARQMAQNTDIILTCLSEKKNHHGLIRVNL